MEEKTMAAVAIAETMALLQHYGFDLGGQTATAILAHWQQAYPVEWLRSAALEALHRGRYKAVSVEEILRQWQKKGDAQQNFDADFETLICSKLEQSIILPEEEEPSPNILPATQPPQIRSFQPDFPSVETYAKLKAIAAQPPESPTPDKE